MFSRSALGYASDASTSLEENIVCDRCNGLGDWLGQVVF